MHDDHGQGGGHQLPQQKPFHGPGSLPHEHCGRPLAQLRDHRGDPRGVIRDAKRFAGRPHGTSSRTFETAIPTKTDGVGLAASLVKPVLVLMRAQWSQQRFGLGLTGT
jgi:hypothetical protein